MQKHNEENKDEDEKPIDINFETGNFVCMINI
jgi:hypothetical protein